MVSWSHATNRRLETQLPVNQWCGSLQQQAAEEHLALKIGEPRPRLEMTSVNRKEKNPKIGE